MKRKLLALFLSLCMVMTVLPMGLFAGAEDGDTQSDTGNNNGSSSGGSSVSTPLTTRKTVENAYITRLTLPTYAKNFYSQLVNGTDNNRPSSDMFVQPKNYVVDVDKEETQRNDAQQVEQADYTEVSFYGETLPISEDTLGQADFYVVDTTNGDKSINLQTLSVGSLVKTSAFNGIYVTSVVKTGNDNYEADLKTAKENILAVCHAFDRDHPEVFWLTGTTRLRVITSTVTKSGKSVQTSYFFYVLADKDGFSICQPEYAAAGVLQTAIKSRDKAIKTILATLPKTGTYEKIQALNTWLTQHNEYNTTADLTTVGYGPHRCLGALLGSSGTTGPVCEGYARAFKVLCDQLQIPCILEDGYAKSTPSGAMGLHMWNSVKMPDKSWYGTDITWDDPVVNGVSGPLSGKENENYLLVGYSSVINGMRFDISHQMEDQFIEGSPFAAGPYLSSASFGVEEVPDTGLPFVDVAEDAYYLDAVKWAVEKKVTNGMSKTKFGSDATCTRGQVVTFLWRAMGDPRPTSGKNPFSDVSPSDYYYSAVLWAVEQGITTGTSETKFSPNAICSQAHIVTFLWRCMGKEGDKGSQPWYADAVNWADQKKLLSGTGKTFDPKNNCPRADVVTYLFRAVGE